MRGRCAQCGFDADTVSVSDAVVAMRTFPRRWRAAFAVVGDDDVDVDVVDFDLEGDTRCLLSLPQNNRRLQNNGRRHKEKREISCHGVFDYLTGSPSVSSREERLRKIQIFDLLFLEIP